jgi:hypothetical protein
MTPYEITITCVALANLGFTMVVWRSSRAKANEARLKALEDSLMTRLSVHDERITRAEEADKRGITHDDLAKIYTEINKTAHQINRLEGGVEQMNENLRLLLTKMVRD